MTAVEWLVQEINKINVSTEARIFINKLEKQANKMFEEQIKDAYKEALNDWADLSIATRTKLTDHYFEETFKK